MRRYVTALLLGLCATAMAFAQYPVLVHSHNDYEHIAPFYQAYAQKITSIECDMRYMGGGDFYVSHNAQDARPDINFDNTYYQPIIRAYSLNNGQAWADDPNRPLQILIDIKSDDPDLFLMALIKKLKKYPEVFDRSVNPMACQVVITGNRPDPSQWYKYPSLIMFDGLIDKTYTPDQLARVALISERFGQYSQWNGKGIMIYEDENRVKEVIAKAHSLGKPIRFWGCPDTVTTWYTWINFGIDFINTDHPETCCEFLSNWQDKTYSILDAKEDRYRLGDLVGTYMPTYLNDGAADKPVKNVILMIGDGMGLQQMVAADRANFGLSMMNMHYMGMVNNSSKDAFTTDSAAAGSGLATGVLHNNRHIAADPDGAPNPSLTDYFYEKGKATAVVTLGNVNDATPAAFYGHHTERGNSDALTSYLLDDKLTLLAGSGFNAFTERRDGVDVLAGFKDLGYDFVRNVGDIDTTARKLICIDEEMNAAADNQNIGLLADATRRAIEKCAKAGGENGFFMMVEGAKIDNGGHSRCLPRSVVETLSFDMAIAEALSFADSNGETLVIVTADHECGALVLVDGDNDTGRVTGYYLSNDHTPVYPIVLSYGPGAQNFMGRYYQREIATRIKALFDNSIMSGLPEPYSK